MQSETGNMISDNEKKFMALFMIVVIVGGTTMMMAEAQGPPCECRVDDDCTRINSICCDF